MTNRIKELKDQLAEIDDVRNEMRWIEPVDLKHSPFIFWIDEDGDLGITTLKEAAAGQTSSFINKRHIQSLSNFLLNILKDGADIGK